MVVEVIEEDFSWINADFIEKVLKSNGESSGMSVSSLDTKLALGKGENYMSKIYRARFETKEEGCCEMKSRQLIIKCFPPGEFLKKFITEAELFGKELKMYREIIPELGVLWRKKFHDGELEEMFPRFYETTRPETVILEDVTLQGFKMASRHNRLDLAHCKLFVKSLAKFHSATAVLGSQRPELKEYYTEKMYTEEKRVEMEKYVPLTVNTMAEKVEKWAGMERFAIKLRKFAEVGLDKMIKVAAPEEGVFEVLNHGDCWVNNLLFRYSEDGTPEDMMFLDFQISKFGSPIFDIIYFLSTSARDDVIDSHFDNLLEDYRNELNFRLKELGFEAEEVTLEFLKEEYKKKAAFALMVALSILPLVLVDASGAVDLSTLTEEDLNDEEKATEMFEESYSSSRYQVALSNFLNRCERNGWFTFLDE